jgi:RHS repeat-associated protein
MTSDGVKTFTYDSENRQTSANTAGFRYDPLGRLSGAGTPLAITYDNYVDGLIAERAPSSSNVTYRHVFGPSTDEPIVMYAGSGTGDRRFLHADERGSIVAVTGSSANLLAINRYDEYGKTQTSNSTYMGRFLYTGQRYFAASGLYYYKTRFYHPSAGARFMQTDLIGYSAEMNLYAYVKDDPINFIDPLGLRWVRVCVGEEGNMKCGPHWVEDEPGSLGSGAAALLGASRGHGPANAGTSASSEELPCPPPGDSSFVTPEDAGLAAVQAQRQAQQAARNGRGDNRERSFSLTGSAAGGYGYWLNPTPGSVDSVPIPYTRIGGGHLHTIGGGDTLSRSTDMSDRFNRGDVDFISSAFDKLERRGVDVNQIVTILGGENGTVYAWHGRNVSGPGKPIGPDKCK